MKKTILITGGLGYIGSHAVVAFEEEGYDTVILDNCSNASLTVLKGLETILGYAPKFFKGDVGDKEFLRTQILDKYNIDGVIHFAGYKAVGESCENPFEYYENNIIQSIRMFELLEEYGIRKCIFSSSATVHNPDFAPKFSETTPTRTINPYGTTKLVLEQLLTDLSRYKNWETISLRYFNPIGAHPSGYLGELPVGVPNNLLPYVLDVARGKRDFVRVFGNDYNTSDGTGIRDYIDVNDLIDAHVLAYKKLESGIGNHNIILNLGTGSGRSVLEMIRWVEKVSGKSIPFTIFPRRDGDIAECYVASDLALEFLSWRPKISLEESISASLKFLKNVD